MGGARYVGWRMVAVAFFVDFVAVGFFFYSYGVFFKALAAEFGDSRLGVGLGLTVTQSVGAFAAPLIGRALDRYPIRRVIAAGTIAMSLGFLLLSQVATALGFYLVLGVFIGLGAGSMGGLATAKLVTNWFDRNRGTALGIAATGISLSGVVMPGVGAWLIQAFGWRAGFFAYGVFTIVVVLPIVLRWVVTRPEDLGLHPDGLRAGEHTTLSVARAATADVLRDRNFWILTLTVGLLFCCSSGTLTHMVPRLTDHGYSLFDASLVVSVCAGAGVAGKMTYGWLVDRWPARRALWLAAGAQLVGQLVMLLGSGYAVFALGGAIFGFGMGGVVPLQGALVARAFGREVFGRVLGLMRPFMLPLHVLGVPFAGWVFDVYGNYDAAFMTFAALYVVVGVTIVALRVR